MSILTIAVVALIAVVILGLIVVIADEYSTRFGTVERYSIGIDETPNIAADIGLFETSSTRH